MKVNNTLSIQQQNFSGNNNKNSTMTLNDFVNASDEDLYKYAQSRHKKKNNPLKFVGACIGVDAISNMLLKTHIVKEIDGDTKILKAPLSAKLGAGLKTIKGWALGITLVGALMGVKQTILNKNEKFRDLEENHPIATLMSEVGGLAIAYKGIKYIGNKMDIGTKLTSKFAPIKKGLTSAAKKLDNSKISTFITNRLSDVGDKINQKAPALGKTGKFLLGNSVLLMLIGSMLKMSKNNHDIQKTYNSLKQAQTQIKENIIE
jgi:hypothetical protein